MWYKVGRFVGRQESCRALTQLLCPSITDKAREERKLMTLHPSYVGLLADRKLKDAQHLKDQSALTQIARQRRVERRWRLLGWL